MARAKSPVSVTRQNVPAARFLARVSRDLPRLVKAMQILLTENPSQPAVRRFNIIEAISQLGAV
jgi:hypothetical protein